MASTLRSAALRTCGVSGAALLGLAYYQRIPQRGADHRLSPRESTITCLYKSLTPLLFHIEPETAHWLTLRTACWLQRWRLLWEPSWTGATPLDWLVRPGSWCEATPGPSLRQELFGGRLCFNSPVGLAAGFDKNAELAPLFRLGALPGLGFAEVGSVSAQPSAGNPQPRCFRLADDAAVINRMGLNNDGAEAIASRLGSLSALAHTAPVGVNIAKTHSPEVLGEAAVADFTASFRALAPHADFVVLNVSCPNTAEGKTFEEPSALAELLAALREEARVVPQVPVLVKLSPPPQTEEGREQLKRLLEVVEAAGFIQGLVVSNTAGDRDVPLSPAGRAASEAIGRGGLSGAPLRGRSTAAVRAVYELTEGRLPIVGCGGVDSAEAAYEKIRAGASLVELYSSLVFKGPGVVQDIDIGLRRLLSRDGFSSIADAVGADLR